MPHKKTTFSPRKRFSSPIPSKIRQPSDFVFSRDEKYGGCHICVKVRFSVILENVEFIISVVEALDLGTSFSTEVHEDSDGILRRTEITEGLIVLLLGELS